MLEGTSEDHNSKCYCKNIKKLHTNKLRLLDDQINGNNLREMSKKKLVPVIPVNLGLKLQPKRSFHKRGKREEEEGGICPYLWIEMKYPLFHLTQERFAMAAWYRFQIQKIIKKI